MVTDVASSGEDRTASTAPPADEPTASSAGTAVLFEDPEPVDGRGTVRENGDGARTVVTAWGDVTIPETPQRVASVIGDIDFETMLALGTPPIAAGTQGGTIEERFAPHLAGTTDEVEPLAWADGPPVEVIATLQPDLIFTYDRESAELLGAIAPAVPRGAWRGDWKQDLRYVSAVLGRSGDAEQLLADFEARVAELGARIDDEWGEPDTAGIDVLRDSALWDRKPAVAAGKVHLVDNRPWYFPTILGARVILDDVEAALDGA